QLERVIYYQDYIVTEGRSKKCPLKEKQLLTEEQFREARERYREDFEADMGAAAIRTLLQKVDLKGLSDHLRVELGKTTSAQKIKDIVKRLRTTEMLIESGNKAEWMVMTVIPVIPPDLRPLVLLDNGNFATSDLNDLYRRLINRSNRLAKLEELKAPWPIVWDERRELQRAADALWANCLAPRRLAVLGDSNRPLVDCLDVVVLRLLDQDGKRIEWCARARAVALPDVAERRLLVPRDVFATLLLDAEQPLLVTAVN